MSVHAMDQADNESDDPYRVLGVDPGASEETIKRAYRRLARAHHPDLHPNDARATEKFKRIAAAFEQLRDPARRRAHAQARHRVSRGHVPQRFTVAVENAIERAQSYIERLVIPAYCEHWRGAGAEAAARMWRDLDALRDTRFLANAQPGFLGRHRASRLLRNVVVVMDLTPAATISMRHRTYTGQWQIVVLPWALHYHGFRDDAEIDDAVLRILLSQYATILAAGRFPPPATHVAWDRILDQACRLDDAHVFHQRLQAAGLALLFAVVFTLIYSGYQNW